MSLLLWEPAGELVLNEIVAVYLGPTLTTQLRCVGRLLHKQVDIRLLQRSALTCGPTSAPVDLPPSAFQWNADSFGDAFLGSFLRGQVATSAIMLDDNAPLMWAAKRSVVPLMHLLLEARVDVNAANSHGNTAAVYASWNGHGAALSVLLRAGAAINTCAGGGMMSSTPLMAAARFGHDAVVRQLLAADADTSVTNGMGETALSLARHGQHKSVCELLKGCSPGIDWTASSGRHALGMHARQRAQRDFNAAIAVA